VVDTNAIRSLRIARRSFSAVVIRLAGLDVFALLLFVR
jgi:hypothetical protein